MITLHHLTPKQKGGKAECRTPLCRPCHKQVHATFGNADLAKRYATVSAIRQASELQPFLAWIRKQRPDRNFRTSMADAHPTAGVGRDGDRLDLPRRLIRRRWDGSSILRVSAS
jgi:hypothetical protein